MFNLKFPIETYLTEMRRPSRVLQDVHNSAISLQIDGRLEAQFVFFVVERIAIRLVDIEVEHFQ